MEPKPEATLGDYYEKYRTVRDQDGYILTIEIGRISKSDVLLYQKMWDEAIKIIKELSEKNK